MKTDWFPIVFILALLAASILWLGVNLQDITSQIVTGLVIGFTIAYMMGRKKVKG